MDVAVYGDFIYVSDPGNYKIEKYSSDGIVLESFDYKFGGFPVRPGGLVQLILMEISILLTPLNIE